MIASVLKLLCVIAVIASIAKSQNIDFLWRNSSFAVPPKIIDNQQGNTNRLLSSSAVLLPGPATGTNTLLSASSQTGTFTIYRQILDSYTGNVIQTLDPLATSIPLSGTKYTASLDGYLAFASIEYDSSNSCQIVVYRMLLNGSTIDRIPVTDNTANATIYNLLDVFNDNVNIYFAYTQGQYANLNGNLAYQSTNMMINKLHFSDNSIGVPFPVTNGDVSFASCDSIPYTGTAYCIFKQNSAVRGAVIYTLQSFAQSPVNYEKDSGTVTYDPLYLAAVNGYYVILESATSENQISLLGRIVATQIGPSVLNKWVISTGFQSFKIRSVLPYYNGFLIFYTTYDSDNTQSWYMEAFTRELNVNISSVLIATVQSDYLLSSFSVAPSSTGGTTTQAYYKDYYVPVNNANGNPLGLLAIQSTNTEVTNVWYGQILNQSLALQGSIQASLTILTLMILALILLY
jgi:hypothetical protein